GPYVRQWLEADAGSTFRGLAGVSAPGAYVAGSGGAAVITEEHRVVGGVRAAPPLLPLLGVADAAGEAAPRRVWTARGRKMAAEATVNLYHLMDGLAWLPGGMS